MAIKTTTWTVPLRRTELIVFTVEARSQTEAAILAGEQLRDGGGTPRELSRTWLPPQKVVVDPDEVQPPKAEPMPGKDAPK